MLGFGFLLTAGFYSHPLPQKRQLCSSCRLRRVEREGGEVWPESSRLPLHLCSGSPSQSAHLHNLLLRSLSALLSYRLLSFLLIVPSFVPFRPGRRAMFQCASKAVWEGFQLFMFSQRPLSAAGGAQLRLAEKAVNQGGDRDKNNATQKTFCCFNRLRFEPFFLKFAL